MIKVGDRVEVKFSRGYTEIGTVKAIFDTSEYNYLVTIRIYDNYTDVYCNENQLSLAK